MQRIIRALTLAGAVSLVAAACGSDDPASSATTAAPAATTAGTMAGSGAPSDSTAAAGGAAATRVVSLSPTATEMLFAIGAGDQVVAVDDMSNYPAEALEVQTDLSGYTPNVEAIAAYEPDLVLHDGSTELGGQLDALGIAHWVGGAATSFDDIYTQLEELGAATGHETEAAELVASMQADIEAALASVPEQTEPLTYYHELDPTFYSVTSNTFIGQVYSLFGLRNIADGAEGGTDYPQLSPEFIISENPALIFLADSKCCGESPETVAARPGWAAVPAVANGDVVVVDDDIASRWGPRVVEFVQIVADAIAAASAPEG